MEATSTDTLSEVLRAVRLKGAVFFSVQGTEPWVAEAPPATELTHYVLPGAQHVIEYHLVSRGTCYGGLLDEPAVALSAGDILVFPQGDAHVMASAPGMRGDPSFPVEELGHGLPIKLNIGSGPEPQAHIICGFLGCDKGPFNPLLQNLPRMIHVRSEQHGGTLAQLVQLALTESALRTPGSECVLARTSELLFIEVIRRYLAALPADQTGWLSGLRDDLVGRCLGRLHQRPAHAWMLEELAREVGTSRSVLAERFHHFVGLPPMQYLARWRMQLACSLLEGGQSLCEIAEAVGYGSEAALSRAFKREVGVAPDTYRRGLRGSLSS